MKLTHISDTHGLMPEIQDDPYVIVHSGDFCPNRTWGIREIEETFQSYWIETRAAELRAWLKSTPLLLVHGNHDFIHLQEPLRKAGIDATVIDDKRYEQGGQMFYGFPWVPEFGPWNRGLGPIELALRTEDIDLEGVDVLVAHAPMYGVMDRNRNGERCGSLPMRKLLQDSTHVPNWFLHGHIHEAEGFQAWSRGINVSNAATTQRILDV